MVVPFTPSREQLDLSNNHDVNEWFTENKPSIVILLQQKLVEYLRIVKSQ